MSALKRGSISMGPATLLTSGTEEKEKKLHLEAHGSLRQVKIILVSLPASFCEDYQEMIHKIKELDVVALLRSIPEDGLVKGQVGTVVEKLEESVFEVEFCDEDGRAYAMLALDENDLMVLYYSRVEAA